MKSTKPSLVIQDVSLSRIRFDFNNGNQWMRYVFERAMGISLVIQFFLVCIFLFLRGSMIEFMIANMVIAGFLIFLSFKYKNVLLKEIRRTSLGVEFLHHLPIHNQIISKDIRFLDFVIHSSDEQINVEVYNQKIAFSNSEDFTLFLETFTDFFNLKFEESIAIEAGKERLIYKR